MVAPKTPLKKSPSKTIPAKASSSRTPVPKSSSSVSVSTKPSRSLLFPLILILAFSVGVWAAVPLFFPKNAPAGDNAGKL